MISNVSNFEMDIAKPAVRDTTAVFFYQTALFC